MFPFSGACVVQAGGTKVGPGPILPLVPAWTWTRVRFDSIFCRYIRMGEWKYLKMASRGAKRQRDYMYATGQKYTKKKILVKKKKPASSYSMTVPIGSAPVARRTIVRLEYCSIQTNGLAASSSSSQIYNMNTIYDPDRTNAGHSAYGYTTLAALYNRYRVFRFSWDVKFNPTEDRVQVACGPVNGNTFPSTVSLAGEFPLIKTGIITFNGGPGCHFKGSAYLPAITGVTPTEYKADDKYSSLTGTDPTEVLIFGYRLLNSGSISVSVTAIVQLYYWTELWDPLILGQS